MEPVETFEGLEAAKDRTRVWRPWQLKQFEFFHATAISAPPRRHFSRGYFMLVSIHAGISDNQYRNSYTSDQGREGMFRVFEPEEAWVCQPNNATFQALTVEPAWLQEAAAGMLHRERSLPHFPSRCLFDPALSRTLRDLAASSLAPASRLQQEEMLLRLLARLLGHAEVAGESPRSGKEHPAVKRAKEYLEAHYAEEVPLQELANVAYLSPFHLARVFRQTVGVPPHAYQTQLRLAHARTLLAQGLDVGNVAQETGFFDQSHFAQQFRRHFFVKPGIYRKTARYSS
ncbi:helix-turn-helix domain-containing protein [Pseudochelatococcus sp. B33]